MTNEEAIAYGKRVIDLGLNDDTQAFCELAIKALETIPKYKDAYNKGWDDGAKATYEHLKMCEEEKEPTGHWIRMKAYEKWECSECNTVFRFTFKEHDYCPNCGTRMESEDEE